MVVVTVPISRIGGIQFSPPLSAEKWKAINTTKMGSYIKVHFRVAPVADPLWRVNGEDVLTLLSDTQAGSVRQHINSAEIFVYPQAVAYWPLELGRSRFDELANELRRPQGRLYIGGDTTEDSHSEGAVVAALRMSKQIIERRAELK